jgi:hypothetical protein
MNESLTVNAQSYAARRELEIAERLGSGKDGTVFVAERKMASARVAVKAHPGPETYVPLREPLQDHARVQNISVAIAKRWRTDQNDILVERLSAS